MRQGNFSAEQALTILKTEPALLNWMQTEGVESGEKFKEWLAEEKEWLLAKKNAADAQVVTLVNADTGCAFVHLTLK